MAFKFVKLKSIEFLSQIRPIAQLAEGVVSDSRVAVGVSVTVTLGVAAILIAGVAVGASNNNETVGVAV